MLWLNYPNNPTGVSASIGFLSEAVKFAREFDILIAHDAPYMEITFSGTLLRPSCRFPVRKKSVWNSILCPRHITWLDGDWEWQWEIRK